MSVKVDIRYNKVYIGSVMKVEGGIRKGYLYLVLAIVPIITSVFYGQLLESNIGNFKDYGTFGSSLSLALIIIVPVILTLYYIALITFATKSGLIKWNIKHISFILLLFVLTAYMVIITFTSDIVPSCNPGYVASHEVATLTDRIWSILTFYLGILTIYNFFYLIRPVKGFKEVISTVCAGVILFALISIIYSLATEWDKYVNFEWFDDLYQKPDLNLVIKSFYGIPNVYGHTLYFGVMCFVVLSFVFRKYWLILPSLAFLPFVFYSNCRIALVGTLFLYGGYFLYLWIRSFSYYRRLFYFLSGLVVAVVIIFLVDLFAYDFIKFEMENGSVVSLKKILFDLVDAFFSKRINIIKMIPVSISDVLLGFGYGLQYVIPRTYGYYYYFHNSVYEIFMAGGLLYFLFIVFIFLFVFVKLIKLAKSKHKYNYLGLYLVLVLAQAVYGLFESHVALFNDYAGVALGAFTICIPNLFANYEFSNRKYVFFNSDLQKRCLKMSYDEIYSLELDDTSENYIYVVDFTKKLIYELSLDNEYNFIITYNDKLINPGDAEIKIDRIEKTLYVNFK